MTAWNFADVWEVVASVRPELPAIEQGSTRLTWGDFERRANGLASTLLSLGLDHEARVAQYLYNGPEYLESVFASFKAGLVPVNTNYRYAAEELVYLWDDADVEAVFYDAEFESRVDEVRHRLPNVRAWIRVGGSKRAPGWALRYTNALSSSGAAELAVRGPWGRSGNDLLYIYTGGTTNGDAQGSHVASR